MSRSATVLVLLLLLGHGTALRAQPISSFDPDTTRVGPAAPPPGTVDLPVWAAVDVAPYAPYVTKMEEFENKPITPWIGVAVYWPAGLWRRWMEFGYMHWDMRQPAGSIVLLGTRGVSEQQPTINEVVYRTGLDHIAGSPEHPWAFAGVGAGIGTGWATGPLLSDQSDAVASFEIDGRAGFILQVNDHSRVAVFALGGPVYELSSSDIAGTFYRIEVHVSFEQKVRIQRRLLPAQ